MYIRLMRRAHFQTDSLNPFRLNINDFILQDNFHSIEEGNERQANKKLDQTEGRTFA